MPKKLRSLAEAAAGHKRTKHGTVPWHEHLREKRPELMQQIDFWIDELRECLEKNNTHPKFHGPTDFAAWLKKEIPELSVGPLAVIDYYKLRSANAKVAH